MGIFIYNLEFPAFVKQVNLNGYKFTRVPEYVERVQSLQHLVGGFHEFNVESNFGKNAITAEVFPPDPALPALFKWKNPSPTRLDDILLILSLFTMRHVWADEGGKPIADHRCYAYGWALRHGIYVIERDKRGIPVDVGFERSLNRILNRLDDATWQEQYERGHYLLLANQAFRRQTIETTFLLCWTIWEHLFGLHNSHLDSKKIRQTPGKKKVAFLLNQYSLHRHFYDSFNLQDIDNLTNIRNRLAHFGMFPEVNQQPEDHEQPESQQQNDLIPIVRKFIKGTEYLIGKTLGLYEGERFNAVEEFDKAIQEKISQ